MRAYRTQTIFLLLVVTALGLTRCMFYHNTTAKYNAYFLAKERMMEAESSVFGTNEENFNDILEVMATIDTNAWISRKSDLDYIIEMAAKPTQFHESSKWAPYCWILIGQARLYQGDMGNASNSFKYVNTEYKDYPNARHAALIQLMRVYIANGEYNNVAYIVDYLKEEQSPLSDENLRDYHLVMAHFNQVRNKHELTAQHLEYAVPLIKPKKKRARYHYLLGQLYELQGNEEEAYRNYALVKKHKPNFELEFHANLMAKVFQGAETAEERAILYRYYQKLLKDENYFNYRDKVYYELGKFEQRNDDEPAAIYNFTESAQVSVSNPTQKSYAYLKLGEIFLNKKEYTQAADYYDSALISMPKTLRIFQPVKKKAVILREFADQYDIVAAQDRLIMLHSMDQSERQTFLEKEVADERAKIIQKDRYRLESEQKRQPPPAASDLPRTGQQNNDWYFYNDQAVQQGRQTFIEKWGGRPLEDNWRLSSVESGQDTPDNQQAAGDQKSDQAKSANIDLFAGVKSVAERQSEVPKNDQELQAVKTKLEKALYQMGRIYLFKLEDIPGTVATFERMVTEFPQSKKATEVLFTLHKVCLESPECDHIKYRDWLARDYPDDIYTKLLVDPQYLINKKEENEAAARMYDNGYQQYKAGNYAQADDLMNTILTRYSETDQVERAALLRAMIVGKTTDRLGEYIAAINQFKSTYPKSKLNDFADKLLETMNDKELLDARVAQIRREQRLDSLREAGERYRRSRGK